MLWCNRFTDFVKSLYCYCQNGGKTTKTLGVLMDKQNHPTFPYRPPNLLVLKWAKKISPAFANLWLLLVNDKIVSDDKDILNHVMIFLEHTVQLRYIQTKIYA